MPTQKLFKQRVRARMTKTGESYSAARRQLLRRAGDPEPDAPASADPVAEPISEPVEPGDGVEPVAEAALPPATGLPTTDGGPSVADESVVRATGKGRAEWFAFLDAWGATTRTHTEIATWLRETQGTPTWWTQTITVDYERARGMRSRHQMRDGFSVSATRTVAVDAAQALAAFTDPAVRDRWLPAGAMTRRPTRAARTVRFDWADPTSRVVVTVVPRDAGRSTVAVAHERIQDGAAADRLKAQWRAWLTELKGTLERD